MAQPELSDNLIEQFGRQILVPGIDEQGQLNLSKRKICIIGLGALGTVASQYLVRSGIGEVHLIDPDQIEESNLHRQINYTLEDVGAFKSEVSKNKLQRINDITKITSHQTTYKNYLKEHTNENFDLVFDCTDNHENKILSSQLGKKNKIAYVSISINSTEGIYFSQNYKKDTTSEFHGALGYFSEINLKKRLNTATHLLKPKMLIRYSPGSMRKENAEKLQNREEKMEKQI